MKRLLLASLSATVWFGLAPLAQAETYPDRPIKIVIPFAPGGAVDSFARIIGAKIQETLKQPVLVENRAGAGGNIAADAVAKSPNDGYTILLTTNGHAISPALYKKLPYDAVADFTPVTHFGNSHLALVVAPNVPAKTWPELAALAREKPGQLNYGSTGVGNPLHLTMEILKSSAKLDIQMVPFRGDAPLTQALTQGLVQMAVVPLATALTQIEAGSFRAIGVTNASRAKNAPDIPTIAEQGMPGLDAGSWSAFFFPANTKREIVDIMNKAIVDGLKDPDVLKRLAPFGVEPVGSTPEALAALMKADIAKYTAIIKQANIPQLD